ncbi:MAG: histidine phosphatase family protein [Clostridia bacterium]|nr:histidine phosphatase family protein [Clostridia bacterium]
MLLFYIRHGDPIYNPDSLTPLGERQAEAVAKRLALYGIDEIYSSTAIRAQLTAKPTSEILKKDVKLLDFCNEIYVWNEFAVDDGDGMDWIFNKPFYKKLFASNEITELGDKWYEHDAVKDYGFEAAINRVNTGLDGFVSEQGYVHNRAERIYQAVSPSDKRVALFAHQGFFISFLSGLLDIPYPIVANHFNICTTGMTVIEFKNEKGISIPKVLTASNDSHLYREGLPTNYIDDIWF